MRAIPPAIKAMLKTRSMLGPNAPVCRVTFLDKTVGYTEPVIDDSWSEYSSYTSTNYASAPGNWVTMTNGKFLLCFQEYSNATGKDEIWIAYVTSETDIWDTSNPGYTTRQKIYTKGTVYGNFRKHSISCNLLRKKDGKLLLFILDPKNPYEWEDEHHNIQTSYTCNLYAYESASGNGITGEDTNDFVLLETIFSMDPVDTIIGEHAASGCNLGVPMQLESGRILIPFTALRPYVGGSEFWCVKANFIYISDDGGITWSGVTEYPDPEGNSPNVYGCGCQGIGKFNDTLVWSHGRDHTDEHFRFSFSNDDGENWEEGQPSLPVGRPDTYDVADETHTGASFDLDNPRFIGYTEEFWSGAGKTGTHWVRDVDYILSILTGHCVNANMTGTVYCSYTYENNVYYQLKGNQCAGIFYGGDGYNYLLANWSNPAVTTEYVELWRASSEQEISDQEENYYCTGMMNCKPVSGTGLTPLWTKRMVGKDTILTEIEADGGLTGSTFGYELPCQFVHSINQEHIGVVEQRAGYPSSGKYGAYVRGGSRQLSGGGNTMQIGAASTSRQDSADAQRCTISFHNVSPIAINDPGYYTPYRNTEYSKTKNDWYLEVLPSKDVRIEAGYGTELSTLFTGTIDDVDISRDSTTSTIRCDCRDYIWKLLDQQVDSTADAEDRYVLEYPIAAEVAQGTGWLVPGSATNPEGGSSYDIASIVKDLCCRAGFLPSKVNIEMTKIELDPAFSRVSYMDAVNQMITAAGCFEFYVDELGTIYFNHISDLKPEALDEVHAALGGFTLNNFPVVPGSDDFWGSPLKTGTYWTRDTDYTIEESTGVITNINMTGNVYCNYVYPAYVFQEGVDLMKLSLKISKRNLYGSIRVAGEGSDQVFELGTSDGNGNRVMWDGSKVPDRKVMFVDGEYIDTDAKALEIATRLGRDMENRYISCEFAAVAVPWLQIGDTIQVLESATTISELYRITSMDFDFSNGAVMTIKAYHVGFIAAPT
jgi:hypothetical protein